MKRRINYIVVGTGRCGTLYMARLLTSLGELCTHEGVFTAGGIGTAVYRIEGGSQNLSSSPRSFEYETDWLTTPTSEIITNHSESSYMASPYLDHPILEESKVIHIVRHPIDVISSFCLDFGYFSSDGTNNIEEEHIYVSMPSLHGVSYGPSRASFYYRKWNEMIEEKCALHKEKGNYLFHRIEDDIDEVVDFVGRKIAEDMFADKKSNTRKHRTEKISLRDISQPYRSQLIEIADRYGYTFAHSNKPPIF